MPRHDGKVPPNRGGFVVDENADLVNDGKFNYLSAPVAGSERDTIIQAERDKDD